MFLHQTARESFLQNGLAEASGLIRHFEEQEKRQLLDAIAVGQPVITQDVAGVPELLEVGGWIAHDFFGNNFRNRRVVSSRSISLAATAKVSSSHSGPSVFG